MNFLTPGPLVQGDRIAIVSPAGIIRPQLVYEAAHVFSDRRLQVVVGPHAFDRYGTFAGTDRDRLEDLEQALTDPSIRAIVCSRGGYGSVRLIERLDRLPLRDDPKWVVGYSDVSALHALMSRHAIKSLHAPMCRHLAETHGRDLHSQRLFDLLGGKDREVTFDASPLNRHGSATGRLAGGNLAVISALVATPYDVIRPGTILFIEDIAEPIYKVERILYALRLSGVLGRLGALIVGQFTRYEPSRDYARMETMISAMVEPYAYPVVYNAPIGHVSDNIPMVCGDYVRLTVDTGGATLSPLPEPLTGTS